MQICEPKARYNTDPKGKELMDAEEVPVFQIPNQVQDHSIYSDTVWAGVSLDSSVRQWQETSNWMLLGLCCQSCLRAKNPIPVLRVLEADFREQEVTKEYGKNQLLRN